MKRRRAITGCIVAVVLLGALLATGDVLLLGKHAYEKLPRSTVVATIPSLPVPPKPEYPQPLPADWQAILPLPATSSQATTAPSTRPAPPAVNPGAPGL